MLGATLALAVVVLGQPPSPDPTALVSRLGSLRYAQREAAGAELTKLGRAALPALLSAQHANDPEIRARVSAILDGLERSSLVEPTSIAFDFQDVPIAEAIKKINEQTGLSLTLSPEERPASSGRLLTFRSKGPLPFWKAIDGLCASGRLHYAPMGQSSLGQRDGTFALYEGLSPATEPVSDSGPFRVHLTSVHYQSEIHLAQPRPIVVIRGDRPISPDDAPRDRTDPSKQFYLQLLVAAEPRLSITQNGPVKLNSAIDDRGRSLLIPANSGLFQHTAGYFGINPSQAVRLRVDLNYPQEPAHRIGVIKGTIPVIVATRKPNPIEVALASAWGKTFRNDEIELTVRDTRAARNNQPPTIELTIRPLGNPIAPLDAGEGEPLAYRAESPQNQIEILDAQGKVISWFPSGSFYTGEETRLTLTLLSRGVPPVPATLRYHGIIRAPSEVSFEFRDIPIP